MSNEKPAPGTFARVRAAQLEYNKNRAAGYREQALRLFPWICGRCAREFNRRNLPELTVHHKDHNHDNNPGDGSNWELLCVYCHDEEHSKFENLVRYGGTTESAHQPATHSPFAQLRAKMEALDTDRGE
jgi:hypothetical protein